MKQPSADQCFRTSSPEGGMLLSLSFLPVVSPSVFYAIFSNFLPTLPFETIFEIVSTFFVRIFTAAVVPHQIHTKKEQNHSYYQAKQQQTQQISIPLTIIRSLSFCCFSYIALVCRTCTSDADLHRLPAALGVAAGLSTPKAVNFRRAPRVMGTTNTFTNEEDDIIQVNQHVSYEPVDVFDNAQTHDSGSPALTVLELAQQQGRVPVKHKGTIADKQRRRAFSAEGDKLTFKEQQQQEVHHGGKHHLPRVRRRRACGFSGGYKPRKDGQHPVDHQPDAATTFVRSQFPTQKKTRLDRTSLPISEQRILEDQSVAEVTKNVHLEALPSSSDRSVAKSAARLRARFGRLLIELIGGFLLLYWMRRRVPEPPMDFLRRVPSCNEKAMPELSQLRLEVHALQKGSVWIRRPGNYMASMLNLSRSQRDMGVNVRAAAINKNNRKALEFLYEAKLLLDRVPKDASFVWPFLGMLRGGSNSKEEQQQEVAEEQNVLYIFEPRSNGSLADHLDTAKFIVNLPVAAAEMSFGLKKLHKAGLLHRRVNLTDFCVDERGHLALTNFHRAIPNPAADAVGTREGALDGESSAEDIELLQFQLAEFPTLLDASGATDIEAPEIRRHSQPWLSLFEMFEAPIEHQVATASLRTGFSEKSDIYRLGLAFEKLAEKAASSAIRLRKKDAVNQVKSALDLQELAKLLQAEDPNKRPSFEQLLGHSFFRKLNVEALLAGRGPLPFSPV